MATAQIVRMADVRRLKSVQHTHTKKRVICENLDDALEFCERVLRDDKRSYHEISGAMMRTHDFKVSGQTLTQLGVGMGPQLRFQTLLRIAQFYGYTLILD